MRILIRTSRLASWARRFASFALPLVVIPVFLHRAAIMDSETFALVETLGLTCAFFGFMLGAAACIRLWFTGDRGWGRAITGILLGLACLMPFAYRLYLSQTYPATPDILSDPAIPVALAGAPARDPASVSGEEIMLAFPHIGPRQYQLGVNDVYRIVDALVAARGWQVLQRQPPQLEAAVGQINAVAVTWLGWRDEIAIGLRGNAGRTEVAVRSASPTGGGDLGVNGRRVDAFLADLDAAVTEAVLNAPAPDGPPVPMLPRPDRSTGG